MSTPDAKRGSSRPRKGGETRERILVTAQRLFSERGIEGVSVRTILAEAGANVALAHRHFGGRDGLIDEVLRRTVGPLNERRLLLLEEVEARGDRATAEDVLRALFAPSIRWLFEHPRPALSFARTEHSWTNGGALVRTRSLGTSSSSAWSAIPALLSVVMLIVRTHLEDPALANQLEGYRDYQRATHYRLVPGLW